MEPPQGVQGQKEMGAAGSKEMLTFQVQDETGPRRHSSSSMGKKTTASFTSLSDLKDLIHSDYVDLLTLKGHSNME